MLKISFILLISKEILKQNAEFSDSIQIKYSIMYPGTWSALYTIKELKIPQQNLYEKVAGQLIQWKSLISITLEDMGKIR